MCFLGGNKWGGEKKQNWRMEKLRTLILRPQCKSPVTILGIISRPSEPQLNPFPEFLSIAGIWFITCRITNLGLVLFSRHTAELLRFISWNTSIVRKWHHPQHHHLASHLFNDFDKSKLVLIKQWCSLQT